MAAERAIIIVLFIERFLSLTGRHKALVSDGAFQARDVLFELHARHKIFFREHDERAVSVDEHKKIRRPCLVRCPACCERLLRLRENEGPIILELLLCRDNLVVMIPDGCPYHGLRRAVRSLSPENFGGSLLFSGARFAKRPWGER